MKKKKIALLLCATTIATNVGVVNAAEVQTSKEPTENLQLKNEEENSSQSGSEIEVTTGAGVVVETPEEDKDEIVNESEKVLKVNTLATLATTDAQVTIETPVGYNDNDYQQLVSFLRQVDTDGVSNAEKCGVKLTQEGVSKLAKDESTVEKERAEARASDVVDGENKYLQENPYISWVDVEGEKYLKSIEFVGRKLCGNLDLEGCPKLVRLTVSGVYSNRTGHGEGNNINEVSISNCGSLKYVGLVNNNSSSINIDGCTSVTQLSFANNPVSRFDFSKTPNIVLLNVGLTNITSLDLSMLDNLHDLTYTGDNLTSIVTSESDPITNLAFSSLSSLDLVGLEKLNNLEYIFTREESSGVLDLSKSPKVSKFYINKLNLTGLKTAGYSVSAESNGVFKYYSYVADLADDHRNQDTIGHNKYSKDTLELQSSSATKTGEWTLVSRADGSTKTVYGKTLEVSEAEGYDVVVDKVDISIPKIEDIKVKKGTSIENVSLPGTLDVSFGDSTTTASVTWDTNNYNGDEDGTYTLIGILEIPGIENLKVTANVIVGDSKDAADSSIVNISKLNDIEIEKGTSIENIVLPKTVNVELSNSTTTEAEVTWDTSNYNGDVAETYKLSGKISLPEGVINPSDLTATINLIVKESGETTSSLDKAYELIKSKLDTITYKNTTTEDSILSSLSTVTLPSDIAIEITESNLVKATYSKAGTLTLTLKIKSKNGESKELTYVGNIAKLTSSSSSGHSGGSSSNNSNSADSTETEDKNNDIVNDNKTENNAATTTVVKTPSGVAVNVPTDKQAWVADNGQWLLFDKGNKATGWNNVNSTWYYLDNTGIMKTGWVKDNVNWYYLNGNGSMTTGWVKENNTWYYLNGNGAMKTGWHLDNNVWYYLNSNGAMKTGWHLDSNGKWYYLNDNGSMAKDTYIDGYYVNANGEWE